MKINTKAIALVVVMAFQLADVMTTHVALQRYGLREANPLMAYLMKREGEAFAIVFKLSVVLLTAIWLIRRGASLSIMAGTSAAPVINNIVALMENHYSRIES